MPAPVKKIIQGILTDFTNALSTGEPEEQDHIDVIQDPISGMELKLYKRADRSRSYILMKKKNAPE